MWDHLLAWQDLSDSRLNGAQYVQPGRVTVNLGNSVTFSRWRYPFHGHAEGGDRDAFPASQPFRLPFLILAPL